MERTLLRLSDKERDALQLVLAALRVSEYTDDVDDFRRRNRDNAMLPSMKEFFSTVVGLTIAASELPSRIKHELETTASNSESLSIVQPLLASSFEVVRRHKRLNPHHNRSEYGKLVMILQDANTASRMRDLGMKDTLVSPVKTVGDVLNALQASEMLRDPLLKTATMPSTLRVTTLGDVHADEDEQCASTATRSDAFTQLMIKYGDAPASGDGAVGQRKALIEQCVKSIADARGFIQECVYPIETLMLWLDTLFNRDAAGTQYSIAIRSGSGGACFSHDHDTHRAYVKESLTLWRIVQRDMFDFWECVEEDMISRCRGTYCFQETGQGFHRMLSADRTYARMQTALSEARRTMGGWVGSTVVHLGDRDVPNALVFIDKYTIIPKMLMPIVQTIQRLEEIFDDGRKETYPGLRNLLKSKYGSCDALKRTILCDFFKHAFDGSGDDGGSCIDGRLTSAWNWCHLLHKKDYYDAFVLTGFTGFDG